MTGSLPDPPRNLIADAVSTRRLSRRHGGSVVSKFRHGNKSRRSRQYIHIVIVQYSAVLQGDPAIRYKASFHGQHLGQPRSGFYRCICCDNTFFSSETKFNSGTGWPSFWQPLAKENVIESVDKSIPNRTRTAVSCRECDAPPWARL
jgi:SelR domain